MEDKKISIDSFISHLQYEGTYKTIARKMDVDPTDKWFEQLYENTLNIFFQHMPSFEKRYSDGIPKEEASKLLSQFYTLLKIDRDKRKASFKDNKMVVQKPDGKFQTYGDFSLNEDSKEEIEKKRNIYNMLEEKGVIKKLQDNFDGSLSEFKKALKFAFDMVYEGVADKDIFLASDIEEMHDELYQFIYSFKEIERAFTKKDDALFFKSKYATMGLNESIEDWNQTKLKQFIKKEFEAAAKKEKYMSETEVKDLIRKSIVNMFKFLWEKSSFFIRQI